MIKVEATKILLEYKAQLKQEVLDLRQKACEKAAVVRAIEKALSIDDIQELADWTELQEAYSIKGISKDIYAKKE